MARSRPARRLLIERLQVACLLVERERANAAAFLVSAVIDFADGVEETLARMHGKERRVLGLGYQCAIGQLARLRIHVEAIDAFAVLVGIGADVDPQL